MTSWCDDGELQFHFKCRSQSVRLLLHHSTFTMLTILLFIVCTYCTSFTAHFLYPLTLWDVRETLSLTL